jgi:hypothetical protein
VKGCGFNMDTLSNCQIALCKNIFCSYVDMLSYV